MLNFVYAIKDKRTGQVGYVGITENPNRRMKEHLAGRDENGEKHTWLMQADPEMEILEACHERRHAEQKESAFIQQYLAQGMPLTNRAKTALSQPIPQFLQHLADLQDYQTLQGLDLFFEMADLEVVSLKERATLDTWYEKQRLRLLPT